MATDMIGITAQVKEHAGHLGARIVAHGTPEDIAAHATSYTGQFLRAKLDAHAG